MIVFYIKKYYVFNHFSYKKHKNIFFYASKKNSLQIQNIFNTKYKPFFSFLYINEKIYLFFVYYLIAK